MKHNALKTADNALGALLKNPKIWRASDTLRGQACQQQTQQPTSSGFKALDQELPNGGWPQHGLVELLCARWGVGELPFLSPAIAQLSQQGRWLAWVSPPWLPYAPGLNNAGIRIDNVIIIKTQSEKNTLWAMEECLQSGCCSTVLGWPKRPTFQQLKRLHIAAQKGNSLCVLMRHEACAKQPSPALVRVELGTLQKQLSVRILKRRGSWCSQWLTLPLPTCLASLNQTSAPTQTDLSPAPLQAQSNQPAPNQKLTHHGSSAKTNIADQQLSISLNASNHTTRPSSPVSH